MNKIIASGVWKGEKMIVEVERGKVYIDGLEDNSLDPLIHEQHPMGGTYYAEAGSMENALNTLKNHFFDDRPEITLIGLDIEEMPSVAGRIY